MSRLALITTATLGLVLAACSSAPAPSASPAATTPPTVSPQPTVTAPASPAPTPPASDSPSPAPATAPPATAFPEGSVIVTFQVEAEQFKVLLTDPVDVAIAAALLAGDEAPTIPNGLIVRDGPGVNAPWSWHLDPDSIEFADVTVEVCDGLPSHVEERTLTSDRYCPWGAVVTAVEPAGQ